MELKFVQTRERFRTMRAVKAFFHRVHVTNVRAHVLGAFKRLRASGFFAPEVLLGHVAQLVFAQFILVREDLAANCAKVVVLRAHHVLIKVGLRVETASTVDALEHATVRVREFRVTRFADVNRMLAIALSVWRY